MILTLSKQFKYEDVDITEIELDFDSLTGSTLRRADKEYKRREKPGPEEFAYRVADEEYCFILAAIMTGIKLEILHELPVKDYRRLFLAVTYFLANLEEPENLDSILARPSAE
jgi:hypothetical protein